MHEDGKVIYARHLSIASIGDCHSTTATRGPRGSTTVETGERPLAEDVIVNGWLRSSRQLLSHFRIHPQLLPVMAVEVIGSFTTFFKSPLTSPGFSTRDPG